MSKKREIGNKEGCKKQGHMEQRHMGQKDYKENVYKEMEYNEKDYIEEVQAAREKALRLMEALSGVDEELVARSEGAGSTSGSAGHGRNSRAAGRTADQVIRFYSRGSKILAACFVFAVLGAVFGAASLMVQPKGSAAGQKEAKVMEEIAYDAYGDAGAAAAAEAESTTAASGVGVMSASGSTDGGRGTDANADPLGASAEGAENEQERMSELSDGVGENGADNSGKVSASSQGSMKTDTEDEKQNRITDDSAEVMEALKEPYEEITEKEARAMEVLGSYIPTAVPAGYRFESAGRSTSENSAEELYVLWTKGMDDIHVVITDYYMVVKKDSGEENLNIADPLKPETYDEHLYEIPYADTVPSEYRAVFDNPVFHISDFSLDIVKARMKSYDDSGDTGTPRGNFSVLYDNGILVRFNGDGTPEDIWAMFQSIQP